MNPQTTPNPPPLETDFDFALPISPKFRVNPERGSLDGLAILTGGREAAGHGIYLDQRSVDTAATAVAARGGRLRGAITHGSLLGMLKNGGDRLMEVPGFFSDVKAPAGANPPQLVGDFQFYDTFRAEQPQAFARLMEMAAKTPDLLGLSAEPSGYLVFVAEDGTEYTATFDRNTREVSGAPDGVPLKYDGLPAVRITRLRVAAFVDEPAANDGLFAKLSRLFSGGPRDQLAQLRSIATAFVAWANSPAAQTALTTPATIVPAENSPPSSNASTEMITFAAIKAKFGAAQDKLARALHLAAEDPTRTLEQVETALAAESPPGGAPEETAFTTLASTFAADKPRLARALAHLAADSKLSADAIIAKLVAEDWAELAQLRKDLAAEKTARATAEQKFAAIKNSGHPEALNLGVGGGAGGGTQTGTEKKPLTGRNRVAAAFAAKIQAGEIPNN